MNICIQIATGVLATLSPNEERMRAALVPEMLATDFAESVLVVVLLLFFFFFFFFLRRVVFVESLYFDFLLFFFLLLCCPHSIIA